MSRFTSFRPLGWAALSLLGACSSDAPAGPSAISQSDLRPALSQSASRPAGTATLDAGGSQLELYPYTLVNFSDAPADRFDPINLVFTGVADPRQIRADLMALNGSRPDFPALPMFQCIWKDAIGDMQTTWTSAGWAASVIQLRCGEFGPVRFHLRLFRAGAVTVANAHFEVLIEGTADHQVLSWAFAEQLVTYDMARTGLLAAAPAATPVINTLTHREIPAVVYNLLPGDLRALLTGSPDPAAAAVPIGNGDGRATLLTLGAASPYVAGTFTETLPLVYGQAIPKPFCAAGPLDFLFVEGPVQLEKTVTMTAAGDYRSRFSASGRLSLTPIDPLTGQPTASPHRAAVAEHQESAMSSDSESALATVRRTELPQGGTERGRLFTRLQVGPAGVTQFTRTEDCD
jgi:hypothetical protein